MKQILSVNFKREACVGIVAIECANYHQSAVATGTTI